MKNGEAGQSGKLGRAEGKGKDSGKDSEESEAAGKEEKSMETTLDMLEIIEYEEPEEIE